MKYFISILSVFLLLGITSCSKDDETSAEPEKDNIVGYWLSTDIKLTESDNSYDYKINNLELKIHDDGTCSMQGDYTIIRSSLNASAKVEIKDAGTYRLIDDVLDLYLSDKTYRFFIQDYNKNRMTLKSNKGFFPSKFNYSLEITMNRQ